MCVVLLAKYYKKDKISLFLPHSWPNYASVGIIIIIIMNSNSTILNIGS